ncbi:MAG: DUF59 domain-containing protein [Magnetococcales bacterium]|nr:DUF59 domain-containing protein [Magnetococcales bacterium]MBF0420079.1 DUF59 domain-containing protein [Magnetococcales bacterium]MBF0434836.1 DUF59 domain-containing protein [Magnetococcales bacterium]
MEPVGKFREGIIRALSTVVDPEVPVNIYDLGLVYDLDATPQGLVTVGMTLTAPGCPVAQSLPDMVKEAVSHVEGVTGVAVELRWDPPWSWAKMTENGRWQMEML